MKHKNAQLRYEVLDQCFGNHAKRHFIKDLMEAVETKLQGENPSGNGVSKKQLYQDMLEMERKIAVRNPQVKLLRIRDGLEKYYRYSDRNFSLFNNTLNEEEVRQLRSTLTTLSRFRGLPQFDWIHEIILKLEQKFRLTVEEQEIMGFQTNEDLEGRQFITPLFNAIQYRQTLDISYKPFYKDKAAIKVIHPYYLKQYNNRWFLLGWNPDEERLATLALDRIVRIRENNKEAYLVNSEFDFRYYFEDFIGTTRYDGASVEITLRFCAGRAPYVLTKPLHMTQKAKYDANGELIVRITVIPNPELDSLVLSFGPDVEVVKPRSYRDRIQAKLEHAAEQYRSSN
jgi:predicted DNA-binding transcriptional regulator YafY